MTRRGNITAITAITHGNPYGNSGIVNAVRVSILTMRELIRYRCPGPILSGNTPYPRIFKEAYMGNIRIVNLRNYRPNDKEVVIRIDRKTILGNPYVMQDESDRDEVIRRYELHFNECMRISRDFLQEVQRIEALYREGKDIALACWCAPKRCHGDIILAHLRSIVG